MGFLADDPGYLKAISRGRSEVREGEQSQRTFLHLSSQSTRHTSDQSASYHLVSVAIAPSYPE